MAELTKPTSDRGWTEPESPASEENPPLYPYNSVTQTESGHSFEMDDTPSRERIRLQHRVGTFIEMHPNGDEVHKVYGDGYEITIKNKNVLIEGTCSVTINGDSIVNVKGNKTELIEGDYNLLVKGEFIQGVGKQATIVSDGDMTIGAKAEAGGRMKIATGDHLQLNGDLHVAGEITADKIYSETRVDAGTGVSAGLLGFVTSGGMTVGLPIGVAVPGNIICAGLINAGISINAPVGTFGLMDAILMTDVVNTGLFNTHVHPTPAGLSGVPTLPMV